MTLPEHEYAAAERKRRDDEIWNDALEEAAYSVAELAEHVAGERDWKDGARQARWIAAAIRAIKRPTS